MKIKLKDTTLFNQLLVKKGLSKRSLSQRANIGQATIVQISNGKRNPSPVSAKKILDVLGEDFDNVFEIHE